MRYKVTVYRKHPCPKCDMTIKLFEQHGIPFDISTIFVTNVYVEDKEVLSDLYPDDNDDLLDDLYPSVVEYKETVINPEVKPYVDMGLRTAPIVVIKDLLSGEPITYWGDFQVGKINEFVNSGLAELIKEDNQ